MTKYTYVKIKLHGGNSYIQPINELHTALDGELDCLLAGEKITLTLEPVDITDEEYLNLPEFSGH